MTEIVMIQTMFLFGYGMKVRHPHPLVNYQITEISNLIFRNHIFKFIMKNRHIDSELTF